MKRGFRSASAVFGSLVVHAMIAAVAMVHQNAGASADAARAYRDVWSAQSVEVGTIPDRAVTAPASAPTSAAAPIAAAPTPPAVQRDATPGESSAIKPSAARPKQRQARATPPGRRDQRALAAVPSPSAPALAEAEPGGSLGALGLPIGVRHLAKAFVRALSNANHGDSAWSELPLGKVGQATVSIEVDADGRIAEVEIDRTRPPPPVLARMIDRAVLLLRSGTFSLDGRKVSSGVERFVIDVDLTHVSSDPERDDRHTRSMGIEPPTRERPGYARFGLNSGRHVDATVRFATR